MNARAVGGRAVVRLRRKDGQVRSISADHVIYATGYRPSIDRLAFLGANLGSSLRCVERTPVLSRHFESSTPGLFFVGITAANSFGPLLRFAYGAGFAAPRISKHLRRTAVRRAVMSGASLAAAQT